MIIKCDFHIHSCVSPCGDLSMSPSYIAEVLAEKGVKLAALTDHNTALNCPAFAAACKKFGIAALYGMEVQSQEEVHVLSLFSDLQTALDFSNEIYEMLPPIMNNPEKTGDQVYVDENDDILGEVDKYLITSADLSIDDLEKRIHALGGLCIPAHVDRPAFSLMSQFGFIPEGNYDAVEVTRIPPVTTYPYTNKQVPLDTLHYHLTTSSDAHYPEHIARRPFDLDIGDIPLIKKDGTVNLDAVRSGLSKRPTSANC